MQRAETVALGEAGEPDLDHLAAQIAGAFDPRDGGLKGAPKFPNTGLIELLWRAGTRSAESQSALQAATLTLDHMARGGIHDHLGGGFARYSVDARWLVPHFEKMLYDNAQLLTLYALEAKRTGNPLARQAATGIVTWLEREMLLPEGAFAASLDADSEGVEGKFYVWSFDEIVAILGADDAALFSCHYDVSTHGNWEETNILNRLDTPDPDHEATLRLTALKERLLAARKQRVPPARDDKILADWNGLMIAALARASGLLDEPHWLDLAKGAYRFVAESMTDGDGLAHSYRLGRLIAPGFALDHAAMVDAALALHDATLDQRYLDDAQRWSDHLDRHYRDPATGLFGMTRHETGELPVRPRPTHDDAVPNALGIQAANLVRLAAKTGTAPDRTRAQALMGAALRAAARAPMAHGSALNAYDLARNGIEIVLAGPSRMVFHQAARSLPYTTTIQIDCPDAASLPSDHPAATMLRYAGRGAAFICFEGRCLPPVTDPNRLAETIAAAR